MNDFVDYHNGDNLGLEPTTPSPEPPAAPQADDARDAARYRWLRKNWQFSLHGKPVWLELDVDIVDVDSTDELDAAIDAAMDADMQRTSGGDHE